MCPNADQIVMTTDNLAVHRGALQWDGGPPRTLLEDANGDLWRLVERPVMTKWIKAHFSAEEAAERGFHEMDRVGNAAADRAAGAITAAAALPEEQLARRRRYREAITTYQTMIAAVQEASMDTPAARRFRLWRKRGRRVLGL